MLKKKFLYINFTLRFNLIVSSGLHEHLLYGDQFGPKGNAISNKKRFWSHIRQEVGHGGCEQCCRKIYPKIIIEPV